MIDYFKRLDDWEVELMYKAPILVSILIASADGIVDDKEIREAITFAEKQAKSRLTLAYYFREVVQDFEDKFKILIQGYPYESTQRTQRIIEELSELNKILPKMNSDFSKEFYQALKEIAYKIASSSGGLLGMNPVGDEEAKYIELNMIYDPAEPKAQ